MKKILYLIFALCILLCGCNAKKDSLLSIIATLPDLSETAPTMQVETTPATQPDSVTTAPTQPTEVVPTIPTETEPPPTEETLPPHSPLYIEGYTAQEVALYFCEIALSMEYTSGDGNFNLIQKWDAPIRYTIIGAPTQQDLAILENLFSQLNAIEGFPGIAPAAEYEVANLNFYFLAEAAFYAKFGNGIQYENSDGAASFTFNNTTNIIYEGKIGYRTDIDQYVRNSVLLEEVYNLMGFSDTTLRHDSIVYAGYSTPQQLTDMDWLILRLLFHPEMERGMNAAQCTEVIERLYY